ncbi:arginine N-succinyltransferase [Pantoea sp. YR343]|uniref:arginine N-succinyltransferase n=1 Tax=Pantoea sp. YR343 TaxID=1144341 RepID=UPI0002711504|nr:arginine N-succinyltransferase [Pantoea sp. YR343]KAJ9431817.1 arginine N-succinyltransferase [Pantoea sp. YR343]
MMLIRHAEPHDLDDLLALAEKAGFGLTSLPHNDVTLASRIERARKTLQGELEKKDQGYVLVLEDTVRERVVGISALEVAVGLSEPWYNFRVDNQVHASRELNVYKSMPTLYLSNDLTGHSELCTLFLDPEYRHSQNGKLLSKIRLLFIAAFREYFSPKVIAEMRGYSDEQGRSPFWEALGQHFFNMDFSQADYLSGIGQKAFIAELMPRHPVYIDFLPPDARDVISQVHPQTTPARRLLETEGLRYQGFVDIFDGGPTLEAELSQLRAVRESRCVQIEYGQPPADGHLCMVANDNYINYRAILAIARPDTNLITLSQKNCDVLGLRKGDLVRIVTLNPLEKL